MQPADVRAASTTYLRAYERATPDTLLHLLLIGSDNAAARVLARSSPFGSQGFIDRMNEKAKELGLEATHYADPSGLDAANVSSAYDMARLIAFAGNDERIASIMRKGEQSVTTSRRTITVHSTNKLVREGSDVREQVKGGKTGFIRQAGYCLATLLQLPQGDPVAVVVLGARSNAGRFMETKHLFNWLADRTKLLLTNDPAKTAATGAAVRGDRGSSASAVGCGPSGRRSAKMPVVPSSAGSPTFPPARSEPREVVELRRLRERQPQLAAAIDLQLELLEMHRRMAGRASRSRETIATFPCLASASRAARRLLRYEEIALDWGELRRLLRDVSDLLRRFGMMETEDVQRVHALTRESQALEPLVRWWYESMAAPERAGDAPIEGAENFEHALLLAMRPFLSRSAEVLLRETWIVRRGRARSVRCAAAIRSLACGRRMACVISCAAAARDSGGSRKRRVRSANRAIRAHRRSFASPSRTYRVDACDQCQRYLKGFDGRAANRALMLGFDAIATLPLDAAAIQQGFVG